jgi:hypothetical protein
VWGGALTKGDGDIGVEEDGDEDGRIADCGVQSRFRCLMSGVAVTI